MPIDPSRATHGAYQHETTWVREFTRFHGTERITRFAPEDLNGVPLIRIIEALQHGDCIYCEKCDGPGTKCIVVHASEEPPGVRVVVHLVTSEETLTICKAEYEGEDEDGSNHAA